MHIFTNIHIYVEYRCIYVPGTFKGITGPDLLPSPTPVGTEQSILKPHIQFSRGLFFFPQALDIVSSPSLPPPGQLSGVCADSACLWDRPPWCHRGIFQRYTRWLIPGEDPERCSSAWWLRGTCVPYITRWHYELKIKAHFPKSLPPSLWHRKEIAEGLSGEKKGGQSGGQWQNNLLLIFFFNFFSRFLNNYMSEKKSRTVKTTTEKSPRLIWLQFGCCSQKRSELHPES